MSETKRSTAFSGALVFLFLLACFPNSSLTTERCRFKSQSFRPALFERLSCGSTCIKWVTKPDDIVIRKRLKRLYDANATEAEHTCRAVISSSICDRWRECCRAARDCCQRQLTAGPYQNGTCRRTWDEWNCWDDAAPGTVEYVSCPGFVQYVALSAGYGQKTCQENGTWYSRYTEGRNGSQGRWVEWTDYTSCIDKQRLVSSVYLALSCNACSILFLIPALLIFLVYSSLRRQHRIRLHINFFTALLFSNIMSMLWDVIVTHDRLISDSAKTTPVLLANGVGCKILAFLRLYFKSTTYVWMFCEGIYLHRLISDAFQPPGSLISHYASGWGVPLAYCVLYVILRGVYANDSCWANSFGHLEWIIYCPNLLCLIANLFFLCNILRVLLTQLQTHPNEPNNFRRALKATFVLIPLFGVQLFVTIYRLPADRPGAAQYEQFTVFVTNSQGFFVALIFCFFNGEVIAKMKRTCTRLNLLRAGTEITSRGTTLATSVHQRDEELEYPGEANGSLLQQVHNVNGAGAATQGSRGRTVAIGNGTRFGSTGNHTGNHAGNRNGNGNSYSYIPMKNLSASDSYAQGAGVASV